MTVLKAVDWPALFVRLLEQASDDAREAAYFYATTADFELRQAAALAALVCHEHYAALRGALHAHGVDDLDDAEDVAHWLRATGHLILGAAGAMLSPATPRTPAPAGVLLVDPDLPDLPLLPLAAELARATGGLTVQPGALPPGIGGWYSRQQRLVELDPAKADIAGHWRHELAHALDPDLGTRGAAEVDEAFADHLAHLLATCEPATLAEVQPLIDETRGVVLAQPRERPYATPARASTTELPQPGIESLAAFLALPLALA